MLPIILMSILGALYLFCVFVDWRIRHKREEKEADNTEVPSKVVTQPQKSSTSCAPEVIRQPAPKKGSCGITGCKISKAHSHAADLAKRLKENKK